MVHGEISGPVQVISRVSQGSVLGPVLFLIDITSLELSRGAKLTLCMQAIYYAAT